MHHFIFPIKDTYISSGSNHIDGESYKDKNYGQDEILELKKEFWNQEFDYQTRVLLQFPLTALSQSLVNGEITNPRYYLRLYEAEGNSDLSTTYTLTAHPLSSSWDEGTGRDFHQPKTTNGVSWENRNYFPGSSAVTWKSSWEGADGGYYRTGSGYESSQSFSNEAPDVNMDVTTVVENWIGAPRILNKMTNNGFLLRFSGSQETDSSTSGILKFFSSNTNTIYAPRLEVRWDDHLPATGSNTGSLSELDLTGTQTNYVYAKNLRASYRDNEKVKFRFGCRPQYVQKSFATSVQTMSGSFIGEGSGSYSIIDLGTNETVVPFSNYTSMSCDTTSPYFIQWMDGFYPDRYYKILIKLKHNDGQEVIYDNNFEFKVVR